MAGGLANQLFQWANVRALLHQDDTAVVFDGRRVSRLGGRGSQIDALELIPPPVVGSAFAKFGWKLLEGTPSRVSQWAAARFPSRPPKRRLTIVRSFEDALAAHTQGLDIWMRGYFQDPRCFLPYRDELLTAILQYLDRVPCDTDAFSRPVLCVHVRRGDYVSSPRNTIRLGLCSLKYYVAAICYLYQPGDLVTLVSDDLDWCRTVLKPALPMDSVLVRSANHLGDFRTIIQADKLVLSNSSFSWWGAFANSTDSVVAPDPWFDAEDSGGRHLVLKHWIRLGKATGNLIEKVSACAPSPW
jgi:hypothetical protein